MTARSRARKPKTFQAPGELAADAKMEGYLRYRHDEIEAKLRQARESIARGEAKDLEPLSVLLREARRRNKAAR